MENMIKKQPISELKDKKKINVQSMRNIENLSNLTNSSRNAKNKLGQLQLQDSDALEDSDEEPDFYGKSKLKNKKTAGAAI